MTEYNLFDWSYCENNGIQTGRNFIWPGSVKGIVCLKWSTKLDRLKRVPVWPSHNCREAQFGSFWFLSELISLPRPWFPEGFANEFRKLNWDIKLRVFKPRISGIVSCSYVGVLYIIVVVMEQILQAGSKEAASSFYAVGFQILPSIRFPCCKITMMHCFQFSGLSFNDLACHEVEIWSWFG